MNQTRRGFLKAGAAAIAVAPLRGARAEGKKYRACIIGDTGHGDYGHSMELVFAHRADVEVVGLADPDEAGRAKKSAAARAARTYADYREMLAKEKPDLVSIGPRWPGSHRELVFACAEAGAHIYLEKPAAPDLIDLDAMVAEAERRGVKCAVAHQMRLAPAIQTLKRMLGEGIIGELMEMRGRGKEDRRAGGEDLMVLGVHIMDLMLYFAGARPLWCSARVTQEGRDISLADAREATEPVGPVAGDTVEASYAFPGGVMGFFASQKNPNLDGGRFGLDLYGSKGVAAVRLGFDLNVQILEEPRWRPALGADESKRWKPLPGFEDPKDPRRGAEYLNALAIDDLIASIERGPDALPQLAIQSTVPGLEMTLAPYHAALTGGRILFPLKNRLHPLTKR